MNHKFFIIIGLVIAIMVVIGLNVFWMISKNKQQLPNHSIPSIELPHQKQPQLRYTFVGQFSKPIETIKVLKVNYDFLLNKEQAITVAHTFGFDERYDTWSNSGRTSYFFESGGKTLLLIDNPVQLEYGNFQEITEAIPRQTQDQLVNLANEFIRKPPFISEAIQLLPPIFLPVKEVGNASIPVASLAEARYAHIGINIALDSLPIIPKDRQIYPIELLMNLDGSVRKATITLIPDQLEVIGTATLTDPQDALNAINAGGGIISKLHDPTQAYTQLAPGDISIATLNSLEVIYLYDHDIQMLQPYYRFAGTAQTKQGETIEVEVLITALPQEVFKP